MLNQTTTIVLNSLENQLLALHKTTRIDLAAMRVEVAAMQSTPAKDICMVELEELAGGIEAAGTAADILIGAINRFAEQYDDAWVADTAEYCNRIHESIWRRSDESRNLVSEAYELTVANVME